MRKAEFAFYAMTLLFWCLLFPVAAKGAQSTRLSRERSLKTPARCRSMCLQKQTLFDPLGIRDFKWRHVPVNRVTAQGNLYISTRDDARIGELILHRGKLKGRRIVARDWVKRSVANQVPISAFDPFSDFYGYMWYSKAEPLGKRSIVVHFASGNGGNKIYVVPALDIVVAVASSAYHHHYGQLRSQDILLKVLSAAR